MEGEAKNCGIVVLYVVASLCYSYFVSRRIPKGIFRFISLFPIFYLFTFLPLFLSYVVPNIITTIFISWLANFKLILFAFDKGPLCLLNSLPLFIIIAAFPIKIKESRDGVSMSTIVIQSNKWYQSLVFKVLVFAILLKFLDAHKEEWSHDVMALLTLPWVVFLFMEVTFGLVHLTIQSCVGLELEPVSNEPYLATSIQEFWGKRWNIMVMDMLRQTVYDPIRLACLPLLGKRLALSLGILVTFFVSGLMHELLAYNLTRAYPSWDMTLFLVVQGIPVIVEFNAKTILAETSYRVPTFMSQLLLLVFSHLGGYLFFYLPLARSKIHLRFIQEFMFIMNIGENKIKLLLNQYL